MKRTATRVVDLLNPAALLLPAANVIMQLSLPGVGHGVQESRQLTPTRARLSSPNHDIPAGR